MADGELDDVADRLYALPPEEFTAARGAEAKSAGSKDLRDAVKELRRPTVSAWLVNRLAVAQPDLLDQVLDLGPALRAAQQEGRGDALRELGAQRRELVAAVAGTAVEQAGREVTAQVRLEVEQTLEAALADPASADAVRSGRLVRALSYAGFGGVDLEGAVAVPKAAPRTGPRKKKGTKAEPEGDDAGAQAAEAAALDAAAALDDAVRDCEAAERDRAAAEEQATDARTASEQAAAELQRIEQELAVARVRHTTAQEAATAARRRAETAGTAAGKAQAAVATAQQAAERARAELDRRRRG